MNERNENKGRKAALIVAILLAAICIGILVGTALSTPSIDVASDAWDSVEMSEEEWLASFHQDTVADEESADAKAEKTIAQSATTAMNKCKNADRSGWLFFPDICDQPVLFNGDNSYYLNHTSDKEYSANGAIFADAGTKSFYDDYTLIHGHHLRSGKMFGKLSNLKKKEYFSNHRYFYIMNENMDLLKYRVVGVTIVNGGKEIIPGSFGTEAEKIEYLQHLTTKSMYKCDYEPSELNNAVVLHTCDYTFKNAHLLVLGVFESEVSY